jgi:hypothetical protein
MCWTDVTETIVDMYETRKMLVTTVYWYHYIFVSHDLH